MDERTPQNALIVRNHLLVKGKRNPNGQGSIQ